MYLAAMLVRNSVRRWEGVNAVLYEEPRRLDPLPSPPTTRALIGAVEAYVGAAQTLRGVAVGVPGTGLPVDAYIDIVTAGPLDVGILNQLVRPTTEKELTKAEAAETVAWAGHDLLVRAYVRPDIDPVETLRKLMRAAVDLVANPRVDQPPITVWERRVPDGYVFELDGPSAERLRALYGEAWVAPRVRVSDDVREAFQELRGEIREQMVGVMTGGLDSHYLTRLGGVKIVNEQGTVLWPSPP